MGKILSLFLIPVFSLLVFLASQTPAKAACVISSIPATISPQDPIEVEIVGLPFRFYNALITHEDGTLTSSTGAGMTEADGTLTLTLTAPNEPDTYIVGIWLTDDRNNNCSGGIEVEPGGTITTETGEPAQIGDIVNVIRNIINLLVPAAAIAFLIMLIVGGFQFVASGGDPKAAAAARTTLTFAILGIILVVVSWLILLLIGFITGVDVTRVFIPD